MSGNLSTRVERLEGKAAVARQDRFRLVKLCVSDEDIAAAYKEADMRKIPMEEVQIIHLVPLTGPLAPSPSGLSAESHSVSG